MNNVNNQKDDEKNGTVQSIIKAVNILNLLSKNPEGMSLGEISNHIDLPRSTVQRLVNTLESVQYIYAEGDSGITLGPALLRLISVGHSELISISRPWLRYLNEITQETVVLSISKKSQLLIINRYIADRELQVIPRLGLSIPLYSSAAGLALLALENDESINKLFESVSQLDCITEYPLPTKEELLNSIHIIRKQGFATKDDPAIEGIMTIAIAVESILGNFAISLPIPAIRFKKNCNKYLEYLVKCKEEINKKIGVN